MWLPLPPDGPRFLAIVRAITDEIRRGRLTAGERLPSSRALAEALGVHRNTVLTALAELEAQGWITTQPARGTFVSAALPASGPSAGPRAALRPGYRVTQAPIGPPWSSDATRVMHFSAGVPDPRLFPVDVLARAWRRVVRRRATSLLTYGPPEGYPPLRAALAQWIRASRGVAATADHVLIARGSQMVLDLCARALLQPGDRVAVEALGYRPAWDALRLSGATLVPIPVDGDGLDVAALARAHARAPLRALYTTPHHQYPTTITMSASRRLALLALAREAGLIILEDDYDHEFHYDGHPVAPLAAADPTGQVIYVGTLSKVLAPGLRLGFAIAPPPVIDTLARWRAAMDRQGDLTMEAAVAELIGDGELERHVRRMRLAYQTRRDALVAELARRLPSELTAAVPRGGISLWAQVAPGLDVAAWRTAAAARGVEVAPGARYTFDGGEPGALRLVYAPHTPAELTRAVEVLAATRPRATSRRSSAPGSSRRGGPSGSGPPRR